ncbi:MAG: mechanosensitive ion channel family protein [Alsobacter sp.]
MLRAILLVLSLVCVSPVAVAQAPVQPPAGMSQVDFDRLVDAISQAVAPKLKAEGAVAPATAAPPAPKPSGDAQEAAAAGFAEFFARGKAVVLSLPAFFGEVIKIPGALDRSDAGGKGFLLYAAMLLIAIAAALGAERLVERLTRKFRLRLSMRAGPDDGPMALARLLGIALLDGLALGAVFVVSHALVGAWFSVEDVQSRFAFFVLASIFAWRLYLFAFRIVLQPDLPGARLAAIGDEAAAAVLRNLSTAVLVVLGVRLVLRSVMAMKAPSEVISAGQLLGNVAILAAFVWAARASREPVAAWFAGLTKPDGAWSRIATNWLRIAIPFFVLLVAAQVYGAISARYSIPAAMLLTLNTVIGLILFETALEAVTRRLGGARAAPSSEGEAVAAHGPTPPRIADVFARCLRVAVLIFAVVAVAGRWIVDVIGLVDAAGWNDVTRSSLRAGVTLFLAYVCWEIVRFFTNRYVSKDPAGHVDEDERVTGASRLATMMPLLRIALVIVIGVVTLLLVLSELGVNITPLIAGASVFGLAISFGSQTLVRDIVSGIFYLADDAFRVGEYIDCGKAKGTVEGFTLRSIKLRHQNGQVHTIPFGQLGQITNFSRDWTTVKFNLKFTRDTDVEKLRKAVKKIGQEMLEDPEMKAEIIEPLKMQGVADILENAIVARFKFTVRPGKPSFIQRDAVKRMVRAFPGLGIEFASATFAVQGLGNEAAVAGAAASQMQARAQAEADAAGAAP